VPTTRCKFTVRTIEQNASHRANPDFNPAGLALKEGISQEDARAKLTTEGVTASVPTVQPTVFLMPVYAPEDPQSENGQFWEATPSGEIKLSINNPAGAEVFEIGREYYVDFTPAD